MRPARAIGVLLAALAVFLAAPGAASPDGPPVIDFSVTLSGPSDGNVGDTLTYTVTVTNNGPDTLTDETTVLFQIGDETDGGLKFVDTDVRCAGTSPNGPGSESDNCDFDGPLASGQSLVWHVRYQVVQHLGARIWAGVSYFGEVNDPDLSNDDATLQVMPPPAGKISNTAAPTLTGAATVGSTLSVDAGTWWPAWAYSYRYEWDRCTPDMTYCVGTDGPPSYAVTSLDAGCRVAVVVGVDSGLPDNAGFKAAPGLQTDVVAGGPCNPASGPLFPPATGGPSGGPSAPQAPTSITNAALPTVAGAAAVGSTLTATGGTWQPDWAYDYSYRWYRCDPASGSCTPATGAEAGPAGASFAVGAADAGCTLAVEVVASDSAASSASVRSAPSARVAGGPCGASAPASHTAAAHAVVASARLTPGRRDARVRQATIHRTICSAAWVRRSTPSASSLRALELRQLKAYHAAGGPGGYVEDQLIPVDLGGAARAAANLWPELRARAGADDAVERRLNHQVCAGTLSLQAAQAQIVRLKRSQG